MDTDDESTIPADLFGTTVIHVGNCSGTYTLTRTNPKAVKYGGLDEYKFVKSLCKDPTTLPSIRISAMYAHELIVTTHFSSSLEQVCDVCK